jgi:ribosomal protein S18 acetylase RimI-like enzyme
MKEVLEVMSSLDPEIRVVAESSPPFADVISVAVSLDQAKYLTRDYRHCLQKIVLGAFDDQQVVGFLVLLIQVIGSEEGRPPIMVGGEPLLEGYVEAFGVLPEYRRRGVGQSLQEHAISISHRAACYQIRSRSPVSAIENYQLKLKMGYAIHPSSENDSYYFIKRL